MVLLLPPSVELLDVSVFVVLPLSVFVVLPLSVFVVLPLLVLSVFVVFELVELSVDDEVVSVLEVELSAVVFDVVLPSDEVVVLS